MPLRGVALAGLAIPNAIKRLDGSAITSGTWTIYITKDGGTQATIAGSATHEGNGQWTFDLTATEMDAAVVALTFTHTDAAPATVTLVTAPVLSGTAQAGASTTITLAATASATDDIYNGSTIVLGDGQERVITDYVGSTKVATVGVAWASNPTSSTPYYLLAAGVNVRTIAGQTANAAAAVTFPASIGTSTVTTAQVNAEVLDVLATDTFAEPASVPAATSSLKDKINWLFALARNKITQTSDTQALRNDADSGNIATAGVADDGTTFSRNEWS